jgi:hypothetical protein
MKILNSNGSDNKTITILETARYNNGKRPVAAKTLFIKNGEKHVEGFGKARNYFAKIYSLNGIEDLSNLLYQLENNQYAFAVRGKIKDHIDISKPIFRRKNIQNKKWDPKTISLEEAVFYWVMFDIDKINLQDLGFNQSLQELNPQVICDKIIEKYAPELANTTYHYQLSNTAGWTSETEVSIHISFWLSESLTNDECKNFVKFVEERAGFKVLDPMLYNAAQAHYTAKPILGFGVNSDPIANRSGLVKKAKNTLSLPDFGTLELANNKAGKTVTTSKKRTSKKVKNKKSTNSNSKAKTTSNNKKLKTLKAWKEKILETDDGIHECVRNVTRWLAQKYGDNKRYHEQIIKAFQNSKRAKTDPSRFGHDFFRTFDELFEGALRWVQDIKIQNDYSNFFKDVIVPNLLLGKSTDTKKFHSKFIDLPTKDINEKWVCVVDSDLGTGKTEWIKTHIDKYKGKSIVYISPRIALAMAAAIRLGMDDYQVVKNLASGKLNLSVCINSLLRKVSSDDKIDILILDEVDQTIKQLLSNTISSKDRQRHFDNLKMVIKNAQHVLITQHLITTVTLDLLKMAGRADEAEIFENLYQPWQGLPIIDHLKTETVWAEIDECAASKVKFFCACNTVTEATALAKKLLKDHNIKLLLITSENRDGEDQKAFLKNPTSESKKYDAVIYSPTVESGISVENPEYKRTFGFYKSGEQVNLPSDFVQMLFRNREHEQIDVWIDKTKFQLPTEPEKIHNVVAQKLSLTAEKITVDEKIAYIYKPDDLTDLAINKIATENTLRNNAYKAIMAFLNEKMGCKIIPYTQQESEKGNRLRKAGKRLQKEDKRKAILAASSIDYSAYMELKKENDVTPEEYWEIEKYRIEDELQIHFDNETDEDKKAWLDFWKDGRVLSRICAFETLRLTEQEAREIGGYFLRNHHTIDKEQNFYLLWWLRTQIAKSLKISIHDGVISEDNDYAFLFDDLKNTEWYTWAIKNSELVNTLGMGAKIGEKGLDNRTLGKWISAMGVLLKRGRDSGCPVENIASLKKGKNQLDSENRKYKLTITSESNAMFCQVILSRHKAGKSEYAQLLNGFEVEDIKSWRISVPRC